jgi:hypothetical protein
MKDKEQETEWCNLRMVKWREGYAVIATDTVELQPDLENSNVKFQVAGIFYEEEIARFFGMCLAEVNDVPFLNETLAGGYLMELEGPTDPMKLN